MNSLFRKIKDYVIFSPTAQENDFKLKNKSNDSVRGDLLVTLCRTRSLTNRYK